MKPFDTHFSQRNELRAAVNSLCFRAHGSLRPRVAPKNRGCETALKSTDEARNHWCSPISKRCHIRPTRQDALGMAVESHLMPMIRSLFPSLDDCPCTLRGHPINVSATKVFRIED
jgi:hypothetical protein